MNMVHQCSPQNLYLAHETSVESNSVIIQYKVKNRIFITFYGIITESLPAKILLARYNIHSQLYDHKLTVHVRERDIFKNWVQKWSEMLDICYDIGC